MSIMNKETIYIAGHKGMVGSALRRKLEGSKFKLIFSERSELDLRNQYAVEQFFRKNQPDYVFMAAAKVGGINSNNTYRGEFIYDNLMINSNIINAAHLFNVKKLIFLGSSCIYPKACPQPIKEEYLLSDYLEETNRPYAISKIAGIELCRSYRQQYGRNFVSVMPTNLYGPDDNYDLDKSHVIPALIRKFLTAKLNKESEVIVWGDGSPKRDFLHVDDLAEALVYIFENFDGIEPINVGSGNEISISELSRLIANIVGFSGKIRFDTRMPNGTPRKILDISKISSLGWKPLIGLESGLTSVIRTVQRQSLFI